MALINCPECSTSVSDKAISCPSCGCPIANSAGNQPAAAAPNTGAMAQSFMVTVSKSRGAYIILGLLFGGLGFHNFYSGHNGSGAIKVGMVLVTLALDASTRFYTGFSIIALVICGLWSLIEIISVKTDAHGNAMS